MPNPASPNTDPLTFKGDGLGCGQTLLDRHVVAGRLGRGASAFVIDLRGGDVAVAEEFLDLADVDTDVQQQRGGGGSQ